MRVRLNLATKPLEGTRRFVAGSAAVAAVALLACLVLAGRAWSHWRATTEFRQEQAQLQAELARLRAERAELEAFFNRPETVQRRNRAAFLNSLIAQRAFPWTRIFMDLERSLPPGVRVVTIEPRLMNDHLQLRLVVGASSDEAKMRFLKALEESGAFSGIAVFSEARSSRPDESDRIVLTLQADYSVA